MTCAPTEHPWCTWPDWFTDFAGQQCESVAQHAWKFERKGPEWAWLWQPHWWEKDEEMSDTKEGLGIHKAICAIKLAIAGGGGISKDRTAPMGYAFRGIEDFDNILCGLTAEHNVNAYPRILSKEIVHGLTNKGSYQSHVIVEIEWTYVCSLDGSRQVASTIGEAMDTQDKAFNKAMQASRKYADIMVFRIPTAGDDTEASPVYVPHAPPSAVAQPHANGAAPVVATPAAAAPAPPAPVKAVRARAPKEAVPPPAQQAAPPPPPAEPEPFPAGEAPSPPSESLLGRIGEVNSFPLLYAVAQDAEAVKEPKPRDELFTAIRNRAAYLFTTAQNLKEVQEGFPLVTALGQPDELKRAANTAYARFR